MGLLSFGQQGSDKDLVRSYDRLKRMAVTARMPHDRDAWLNLAFYLDEQYVEWNDGTGAIRRIPRKQGHENTPRPVVNKIMHFVQQEKAMVLQAKPTVDIMPATDDLLDITDAEVAKAYCTWVAEPVNANFTRQLGRAVLWSIVCSEAYLKWTWDAIAKRPQIIPCPLFEIASDPYADEFAKARYIIHSKFMDREAVNDAYGVDIPESESEQADPMRTQMLRGMGAFPVVSGMTVNELWHKPCKKYPDGLFATWAAGRMLSAPTGLPYAHRRLPFTQIGCIERPDSQHYMSPVKYLRSAQMELNKYHAQRIMIREAFANPKWWVPAELQLQEMPNDSPRQILTGESNMGMLEPKILQPASYPPNDDGDMIEAQMMHIVGLHEVSQAQVPGRVEAAKAIEMLKESDSDRQQTMLDTIVASISEGFYQVLMLAKQYAPEDQLLQTYSREGLPEVKHFKAQRIDPGTRVNVTMGTGLARSRAARQDQLMNLWQQQIITDPELMAELMEVPFPSFAAPKALDMRLARNENLELAREVAITPNSWDDHVIHLREHNDYRKTQAFLHATDGVKSRFEFHCQTHKTLQKAVLVEQVQLAQLMDAAAGAAPGVAPPGPPLPNAAPPEEGQALPPGPPKRDTPVQSA